MRRRDFLRGSLLSVPLGATRAYANPAPVVLELFTSQGCSSCPPADALLGELTRHRDVIGLAWHVDYWNGLGWRDPFARGEWTDRQRAYARTLHDEVFTPAMVINGTAMVVGSDKSAVHQAIDEASQLPVTVSLRRDAAGLEAAIPPAVGPYSGLLVSYDPSRTTHVGAGENQGRQLMEYRIVRDTVRVERVSAHMTLPAVSETQGAILLIQDAAMRIIGASDLPPAAGT